MSEKKIIKARIIYKITEEINKHQNKGNKIVCFCFSPKTLNLLKENLILYNEVPHSVFGVRVAVNENLNKDYVLVEDFSKYGIRIFKELKL